MKINDFYNGIAPKIDATMLPAGYGQIAENCDVRGGAIFPIKGLKTVETLPAGTDWKTLYKFHDKFLWWDVDVEVVEGPPYKSDRRVFYTGDGFPKQLAYSAKDGDGKPGATEYRKLGVPYPSVRPGPQAIYSWKDYNKWNADTDYYENDSVYQPSGVVSMICVKAHTSPVIDASDYTSIWEYLQEYWKTTGTAGSVNWASGTAYAVDDIVLMTFDLPFKCIDAHRAAAADEPGVGADWATYWEFTPNGVYDETIRYVFTEVNDMGEESSQSLSTDEIDIYQQKAMRVSGFKHAAESGTITALGTTVTGTGTKFKNVFEIGDKIIAGDELRKVVSITDDETLEINHEFDSAVSGEYGRIPKLTQYIRMYRLTSGLTGAEYQYVPFRSEPKDWVTGKFYAVGNYCNVSGKIYKCKVENVADTTNAPEGTEGPNYWEDTTHIYFIDNEDGMPVDGDFKYYYDAELEADLSAIKSPYSTNQTLGEVLPTEDMYPPPDDLRGIVKFSPGVLAGFVGNTIYMSAEEMPYAWPTSYQLKTNSNIVQLSSYRQSLLALTETGLTIFGGEPGQMISDEIPTAQTCISPKSVIPTRHGVFYASNRGLTSTTDKGMSLVSLPFFRMDQWKALVPSEMIGCFYDGEYQAIRKNIMYKFMVFIYKVVDADKYVVTQVRFDDEVDIRDAVIDYANSAAFMLVKRGTKYTVDQYDAGDVLRYRWKSKKILHGEPQNYACVRVLGDHDLWTPLNLVIYGDGDVIVDMDLTDQEIHNLPSGRTYKVLEVELKGVTPIREIFIGNDPEETFDTLNPNESGQGSSDGS